MDNNVNDRIFRMYYDKYLFLGLNAKVVMLQSLLKLDIFEME